MCASHVRAEEMRSYKLRMGRPIILAEANEILWDFFRLTVSRLEKQMVPCTVAGPEELCFNTHT